MSVVCCLLQAWGRYPHDSTPLSTGCAISKDVRFVYLWTPPRATFVVTPVRPRPMRCGLLEGWTLTTRVPVDQPVVHRSGPSCPQAAACRGRTRGTACHAALFAAELTLSTRTTYRWQV